MRRKPSLRRNSNVPQKVQFIEDLSGTEYNAGERVFSNDHRQTCLFAQKNVEVAQKGAPSRKDNPLIDDISREFGWSALETDTESLDNGIDRFGKRFPYFIGIYQCG